MPITKMISAPSSFSKRAKAFAWRQTQRCALCKERLTVSAKLCGKCASALATVPKVYFPHEWHLFAALATFGAWTWIWFLMFLFRDRRYYY